jgi:hypothetical protein
MSLPILVDGELQQIAFLNGLYTKTKWFTIAARLIVASISNCSHYVQIINYCSCLEFVIIYI